MFWKDALTLSSPVYFSIKQHSSSEGHLTPARNDNNSRHYNIARIYSLWNEQCAKSTKEKSKCNSLCL